MKKYRAITATAPLCSYCRKEVKYNYTIAQKESQSVLQACAGANEEFLITLDNKTNYLSRFLAAYSIIKSAAIAPMAIEKATIAICTSAGGTLI